MIVIKVPRKKAAALPGATLKNRLHTGNYQLVHCLSTNFLKKSRRVGVRPANRIERIAS